MPKVSVIIPVYNVEKYLCRCLESLLNQTYDDYEIVCINDCSTDGSQQILEEYASKNPDKIAVYVNEHNMGLGRTRDRGLTLINGEYVMFIDSDDYVKEDFIETYMSAMETHPCDVVIAGFIRDIDGSLTEHRLKDSIWNIVTYPFAWSKLFRRAFLEEHQLKFSIKYGEDVYFSMQAFYHSIQYHIMENYAGYYYYCNRKSLSKSMNHEKGLERIVSSIFDQFMKECDVSKMPKERRWVLEYTYVANMVHALITYGHGCKPRAMRGKYQFFVKDLRAKFPDYKNNPYFGITKAKGQRWKIRMGVGVTMLAHKVRLDALLFWIISWL